MEKTNIPSFIARYFWGDDISQLDLQKYKKYIIETLLEKGDTKAIQWLFTKIDKQTIINFLPNLKLGKKSKHFWNIYFA